MPRDKKHKVEPDFMGGLLDRKDREQRTFDRYRASCGPVKTTRIEDLTVDQRERLGL